jgi:hypothetical protein
MKDILRQIKASMDRFVHDASLSIEKGNKTATIRSQKESLELASLLEEWRKKNVSGAKTSYVIYCVDAKRLGVLTFACKESCLSFLKSIVGSSLVSVIESDCI